MTGRPEPPDQRGVASEPPRQPRHQARNLDDPTVLITPVVPAAEPAIEGALSDPTAGATVARHGATMAIGSIVSRVTGFARTAAIGAAIGAGFVGNDYTLANTLPGMVYELLLGGVLASVVVPLLVRARTNDADHGEAYTHRLLTLAAVFLAGATVVAVAAAPLLTSVFASDKTTPADRSLITSLSYLLLPMIFFYGMAALFAAILNTRGHFAMPMWTPILNNIVVITAAGVFALLPALVSPLRADSLTTAQILVLGLGTTAGIVVQAFGLWPALRKVGFRWKWRWEFRELRLRQLATVGAWMLGYVVVSQIALVIVFRLANMAAERAGGTGPAIFNNAYLIFMMAHGIVAVSIITALMPRMSAAAAESRYADLADQLSLGTRLTAVVLVPATAAYLVLGRPLAVTLFEWGEYNHEQAVATGWVVAVAGLGLVPFAISQLQIFAFYAMPDTKTPALINVPVVILRIVVDVLLYLVLAPGLVAAGLMGGNAVSFLLATIVGYWLLRRRIGRLGLTRILSTVARLAVAAMIAAVPAGLLVFWLIQVIGDGKGASLVELVAGGLVLITTYVVMAFVLRVQEVREVAATVGGRLGR